MAPLLTLRAAARLIRVSPDRFYRAIADGRPTGGTWGRLGKPTLVSLEAWQAFWQREGLHIPDAAQMAELSERPERSERSMPAHGLPSSPQPVMSEPKAAVLQRLQAMQAEGLSLQKIADRLNSEGVPTLSGKGHWQKGTISNLLAQAQEAPAHDHT